MNKEQANKLSDVLNTIKTHLRKTSSKNDLLLSDAIHDVAYLIKHLPSVQSDALTEFVDSSIASIESNVKQVR